MPRRALAAALILTLAPAAALAGTIIPILSDPKATYEELGRRDMGGGVIEITTRRTGALGTSYSRREIRCRDWTFRYTGDADTPEELAAEYLNYPFAPLEHGSVSGYLALYVCRTASQSPSAPSTDR